MSRPAPLQESDLIFPFASYVVNGALSELKRSNLSIKNRLNSIKKDSEFVCKVAQRLGLPLVANERCGSWYIPPDRKVGSVYFKSTDGHFGQWSFSLRRLNLQLLEIIGSNKGCVIVDSTRRGKSMPDALSKTVPIWAAVLNRLLFSENASNHDCHQVRTPLDVVSRSEQAQIETKLNGFVRDATMLGLDQEDLRQKLNGKPIRVAWQRPGDDMDELPEGHENFNLIVLCTASNQTSNQTSATSDYVQGAADDPESWSLGLDAATFWTNHAELLTITEDDLPSAIKQLVIEVGTAHSSTICAPILIKPTANLWIGTNALAETHGHDFDIILSCSMHLSTSLADSMKGSYVNLTCSAGKVGSRQLRTQLPKIELIRAQFEAQSQVLVTCDSGKDLAVGAAVATLCLFFDEQGEVLPSDRFHSLSFNKVMIKQRLSWIMVAMPHASPSRATLQSVNSFLMR